MQACKLNSFDYIVMLSKVHSKMLYICGNSFVSVQAVMQAFIAAIDIVYRPLFTCPICAEYVYTIIIHGKAIGMHRNQAHQCCIAVGAATFNVEW